MTDGRSLRAYYFSFSATGNEQIDSILEAVAAAGKGFHHTEDWATRDESGFSYVDIIQNAAMAAAQQFQYRVKPWMDACFGPAISADKVERNHRFIEEALELVQACGATASECHQLVDYVFGRTAGEARQEAGGVMVTLAALCLANDLDMHAAGETELTRVWGKIEQIRAKQAAKPKRSPLPQNVGGTESGLVKELVEALDDCIDRESLVKRHGSDERWRHYRELLIRAKAKPTGQVVEAVERKSIKEPTEAMCDRARGFVLGLDLGYRTWEEMDTHLDHGGYHTLWSISDRAQIDPQGHITKWDVAQCIYLLMNSNEIESEKPKAGAA